MNIPNTAPIHLMRPLPSIRSLRLAPEQRFMKSYNRRCLELKNLLKAEDQTQHTEKAEGQTESISINQSNSINQSIAHPRNCSNEKEMMDESMDEFGGLLSSYDEKMENDEELYLSRGCFQLPDQTILMLDCRGEDAGMERRNDDMNEKNAKNKKAETQILRLEDLRNALTSDIVTYRFQSCHLNYSMKSFILMISSTDHSLNGSSNNRLSDDHDDDDRMMSREFQKDEGKMIVIRTIATMRSQNRDDQKIGMRSENTIDIDRDECISRDGCLNASSSGTIGTSSRNEDIKDDEKNSLTIEEDLMIKQVDRDSANMARDHQQAHQGVGWEEDLEMAKQYIYNIASRERLDRFESDEDLPGSIIADEFVERRQNDRNLSQVDLQRWLGLCRLRAMSEGMKSCSLDFWKSVVGLDMRRVESLRKNNQTREKK